MIRGVLLLWALLLAAVNVALWLPLQHTSSAVSYLYNGWLYATDYRRHLTLQLIGLQPHHPLGLFSEGIFNYVWSPGGDAILYRFSSTSDSAIEVRLILHYRDGRERLLSDSNVGGDYHWLPGTANVLRVQRHSVARMNMATGQASCLPVPAVTLHGEGLLPLEPDAVGIALSHGTAGTQHLHRLDLTTGDLALLDEMPCTTGLRLAEWQPSPDGEQIAFVCFLGTPLNIAPADDLTQFQPVPINGTEGGIRDVGWSPGGERLLMTVLSTRGDPAPVVLDLATNEVSALGLPPGADRVRWIPTRQRRVTLPLPPTPGRLHTDWNNRWQDC